MRCTLGHLPAASAHPISVFLFLIVLIVTFTPAAANWAPDGELVCRVPGAQAFSHIVSDGAGGAIVAWRDYRNPYVELYLQRVDGAGNTMWTQNGIVIRNDGDIVEIVTDGACGAILVFLEGGDIFAARVDHTGSILWNVNLGISVFTKAVATADGTGGVIIAWNDANGSPTYNALAQRIDSAGNLVWGSPGIEASAVDAHTDLCIAPDGSGGAIIGYIQLATGQSHLYAQRVYGSSGMTWSTNGTLVAFISDSEIGGISIDADAYGSSIVSWHAGLPNPDIFAQKLDPAGTTQWTYPLGEVCSALEAQYDTDVLCDGTGGALIVWLDERSTFGPDVWCQRLDAYGIPLWTIDGVPIQIDNDIYPDNPEFLGLYDSRVLVAWTDDFDNGRIFAQKVDHGGSVLWATNGVRVLSGEVVMAGYDVTADESGSVFASTSRDTPGADMEVYAIAVNTYGQLAAPAPVISSVTDVPDDQGEKVRLTIVPSDRDMIPHPPEPCTNYNVWQRIVGPVAMTSPGGSPDRDPVRDDAMTCFITTDETPDFSVFEDGSKRFITAAPGGLFPEGTWEFIGSFDAVQSASYYYRASTVTDSTTSGTALQYYIVSAHTSNPATWFVSSITSGYSVDNLAPAPPLGLAGEQSFTPDGLNLDWEQNTENDLWYYAVYRGTSSDFTPGAGNMIATPQSDEYFDDGWTWDAELWYKVAAVDENGNESGFAVTSPSEVTGDDPMPLPDATFLAQNFPNPFNPNTTIAFGLKEQGHVSLRVYDAAGRLVVALIDESRPAGTYGAVWNGKAENGTTAASGVYFYRLITKEFEETKKMILLR